MASNDSPSSNPLQPEKPWHRELTRYHWFVLIVAALGWLFDCLDQQLFLLARQPAMRELVPIAQTREEAWTRLQEAAQTKDEQGNLKQGPVNQAAWDKAIVAVGTSRDKAAPVKPEAEFGKHEWNKVAGTVHPSLLKRTVDKYSAWATSIFLLGWATGGLFFGVLGDRIGRAKTMMITILVYSLCTGLSAISVGFADFAFYRFITGLGVGGEFAVGVALVAEVMPERARPHALALLQALSAIGNVSAALISMGMGGLVERGVIESVWRPMFIIGAVPALLALVIRAKLKEPEAWQKVSHEGAVGKKLGSYRELFRHPTWRKHAFIGLGLAFAGVVGLWGVGFYTMDLVGNVLTARFTDAGMPAHEVAGKVAHWKGMTSLMINFGAFAGMLTFGKLAGRWGRRPIFAVAFTSAALSTAAVFWFLSEFHQIFWMVPIMGFCQLAAFAGYAIYFPELFPTHLRSTGTSFCYNVGRFVAAIGPAFLGFLVSESVYGHLPGDDPLRYAGVTMCLVFVIGLLILPFAPETKGKPLPE
ncbi:MAG: MFS transporter [Phycisphaeraceae bacterium]